MNRRLLIPVLAALAGLGLLTVAALVTFRPDVVPAPAAVGGPFSLVSHEGRPFTEKDVAGAPFIVFFGFTHCPDVCPTAMFELTAVLKAAGPRADRVRALFISVDPERDTPELLKTYLESFDPRIVGLTGTPEQVAAAAKAYRAYFRKVSAGESYTMDHTAGIYLMDSQGRFVRLLDMNKKADEVAKDILAAS